jgi:uncharacterized SAM-binding protein YcdF (DUF218 family)
MKTTLRILLRVLRGALMLTGGMALLYIAVLFSPLPWQVYKGLWTVPNPSDLPPTHILVMGGSGIPGESGLMRTFYAAEAARQNPDAAIWVAMPLGAVNSPASQAYLNEIQLRGIPAGRVRILEGGRNTREQALRLAARLAEDPDAACVMIVTSPEHTRRTAAAIRKTCDIPLTAFPAFPISLEDPLPWSVEELDIPDTVVATQTVIPDIGASMYFRYNLWANLRYMHESLRETAAMLYYRLQGWI